VIDGREAGISVFVERQSNGAVRVVVQGMVEGFSRSSDGVELTVLQGSRRLCNLDDEGRTVACQP